MLNRLFSRTVLDTSAIFSGHFIEVKAFYLVKFRKVPSVCFIGEIDATKAFTQIKAVMSNEIVAIYQHGFLDHDAKELYFNNTVFVLKRKRMIEVASNYCQVLHTVQQYSWAHQLVHDLGANCKLAPKVAEEKRVIGFVRPTEMN